MKRFLALAALVLGLASCQTEPEGLNVNVGGEVDTTITVTIPDTETRAGGNDSAKSVFENGVLSGDATMRYIFQVYYNNNGEVVESQAEPQVKYSDDKTVNFDVRLVPDRNYTFVVWADVVDGENAGDKHYNTRNDEGKINLRNITVKESSWVAMDESRDAFTVTKVIEQYNGQMGINLELKRALAKLRVITTDMEALNDLQIEPKYAKVEYTTAYRKGFNAVTGMAVEAEENGDKKTHTYQIAAYGDNGDNSVKKVLFTDYFFAANDQDDEVNFVLSVYENANEQNLIKSNPFNTAIPARRNYLTTIQGNILTDGNNVNVTVDPAFDGYYAVPSEVSELVNVINSAADGVETIIPVNEDIKLPEALTIPAGKNIVLDFAANTTLTGTLVVEDGAKLTVNNGTIKNEDKSLSGITSNGNLTLNNVEITSARHAVRVESGEVVIYGGTFEVKPVSASTLHALNVGDDGKSATVIIKGGTFRGPKGTMADSGSAVNVRNGSTVIIEGGNFSGGKNKTLSAAAGKTLTVKGGFFDQDPSAFVAKNYTTINMNATKEYVYAVMKGSENNGSYNILIKDTAALEFFAEVVDYEYTFAGDVVNLEDDIDLYEADENGEAKCFDPIGSYRFETAFMGTFDGQGHTIKNLYQNTWALDNGYDYNDCGLGLFGALVNAKIQNLTIDDAHISGKSALCGIITAYAKDTTFENITVKNSDCADYQYYAGGIVGWASGKHQYINCDVDASTIIGGQWGDFGNSNGGIIGGAASSAEILMKDCDVACRIDAVNDVVSTYHYYAYRCCGMLIGNTNQTQVINETPYAAAPQLTCEDVTVTYGDWMNYHYCEFGEGTYAYVRVEAGISVDPYVNIRYGHPTDANGNKVVDHNHAHNDGEDHHICLPFDQLLGGGPNGNGRNPVYGLREFDGVTVNYPASYRREVSSAAALTEALNDGLSVVLDADIDFGSTQLAITGENQVVDLGGHALTTANNWGGISLKNGATIKNGTITHTGNTAAIKAFNGTSVENVTINATCTTADKTVTGIAVQQGAHVESIKDVTINGVSQGIEVGYQATVDLIENAVVNESNNGTAKGIGLVINGGMVGKAKDCTFKGETYGITLHLKGVFAAGLNLENCKVEGTTCDLYTWDEKGISNTSGSLVLTYDDATVQKSGANFIEADFEEECQDVVLIFKK